MFTGRTSWTSLQRGANACLIFRGSYRSWLPWRLLFRDYGCLSEVFDPQNYERERDLVDEENIQYENRELLERRTEL